MPPDAGPPPHAERTQDREAVATALLEIAGSALAKAKRMHRAGYPTRTAALATLCAVTAGRAWAAVQPDRPQLHEELSREAENAATKAERLLASLSQIPGPAWQQVPWYLAQEAAVMNHQKIASLTLRQEETDHMMQKAVARELEIHSALCEFMAAWPDYHENWELPRTPWPEKQMPAEDAAMIRAIAESGKQAREAITELMEGLEDRA